MNFDSKIDARERILQQNVAKMMSAHLKHFSVPNDFFFSFFQSHVYPSCTHIGSYTMDVDLFSDLIRVLECLTID